MKIAALAILVTAGACHNSGVSTDGSSAVVIDAATSITIDGSRAIDATSSNHIDAAASSIDATANHLDSATTSIDANPQHADAISITIDAHVASSPDATLSTTPISQAGDSDCWSDGGFGYVRPDAPGYVVATLTDPNGVDDIVMTADMVIYGASNYAVGTSPLISLGQTGCCTITVKAAVTYDDLVETANAVGGPPDGEFWGGQATFHDSQGNATVATCTGDQTEWHAEPD